MMRNPVEFKVHCIREVDPPPGPDGDLCEPKQVAAFWRSAVESASWYDENKEVLVVFMLNSRRRVIGFNLVTVGSLDSAQVFPREVFRPAIVAAAHSIIVAHNHPSGDPTPSEGDMRVTRDLERAGQLLKIPLLDSVVVGKPTPENPDGYASLRQLGYFVN